MKIANLLTPMNIRYRRKPGEAWASMNPHNFWQTVSRVHSLCLSRPDFGYSANDFTEDRVRSILAQGGPVYLPGEMVEFRLDNGIGTVRCPRCSRIFLGAVGDVSPLRARATLLCPACVRLETSIAIRKGVSS